MRKFFLRTKQSKGVAPLYTRFQRKGTNMLINTHVSVDINAWTNAQTSIRKFQDYARTSQGSKVCELLEKIDNVLLPTSTNRLNEKDIINAVALIVGNEARKAREAEEEARKADIEEARKADILSYLNNFIYSIEKGVIKTNSGKRYSKNTCVSWNTFNAMLIKVMEHHYFTWSDIDKYLCGVIVLFLEKSHYMDDSINIFLEKLGVLCNMAIEDGIHTNNKASKIIRHFKKKQSDIDKKAEIYLTQNEIDELYNMEIKNIPEAKVRDIFLLGVFTCQRYSDYAKIDKSCFGRTANGIEVIRIKQEKTANSVVLPIIDERVHTIMQRNMYNLNFNKFGKPVGKDYFNRVLSRILQRLSVSVSSLCDMVQTTITKSEKELINSDRYLITHDTNKTCYTPKESKADKVHKPIVLDNGKYYKPKWALVTSHTARRTGITLLYQSHKYNTIQLMSISGHKTEQIFYDYIKLSAEEIAEEIAEKAKKLHSSAE